MPAFAGGLTVTTSADYLDFDTLLTEEQRLVRDTVGDWVDDKVLPIIEEAAWEGRFPKELIPEMAADAPLRLDDLRVRPARASTTSPTA